MSVRSFVAVISAVCALGYSPSAFAHIALTSPGYADTYQVLTFGVGHGCEGADTIKLEISIPESVTEVRATKSAFGPVEVKLNDAGLVTSVSWTNAEPRAADDLLYQLAISIGVPDAPFTTLIFPAKQTCRGKDGKETTVDWNATPEQEAAAKEGDDVYPAPYLVILPQRHPGWNKFKAKQKLTDLTLFDDAQIVWAGDAAYSSNPATLEQIKREPGVSELAEIAAGAEIWVKY